MPAAGTHVKSDQRREAVLDAAIACFARRGLYGTTTQEIADRAGISQPYVARLFPGKEALFVEAVRRVSRLLSEALRAHATRIGSPDTGRDGALRATRAAWAGIIGDRDVLRFLLQANCAATEPSVGAAVRACYASQVALVGELLGGDEQVVRHWFADGMLDTVVAALDLQETDEPWARVLRG
ncbi:TetR/AcrR family transcriptional regulator [Pseudonocardia sp. ICBG1293]|uniref:TetR/AcrR family transcriptional regulator n=1 Tax=Pseudonocardia sp. ICBG1293 TaxID=2844382 RepID=UPI001CCDB00D|nr:TetR/AcrR family transcriptional regulator [Pseudonocardia sp. ICBG1293]